MAKTADPERDEMTAQRDDARLRAETYTALAEDQPDAPSVARWRDKAARYAAQAEQKQAQIDALSSEKE